MPNTNRTPDVNPDGLHDEDGVTYSEDPRDMGWVRQNVPCQDACPANTNIPSYIQKIYEEKYGESYEINRDANVLPGVLGRICARPCEDVCRHGWPGNGEPVGICNLKRVAADHKHDSHRLGESLYTPTAKRVAIIGAGPAGVAAAHDLSILGHDVTIFEREEKAGGMLRYGIPEFRLPRNILELELHNALRLGVDLKTGVSIGENEDDEQVSKLLEDYDAVLLSTGCMRAKNIPLRGVDDSDALIETIDDVEHGLDFLIDMHRGKVKTVGKKVAVLGAGFTALDCARVARRLGAEEVTIHLRTGEDYIPVSKEEIFEVKREGIKIKGLRSPVGFKTDENGKLIGVEFVQNRLGGWRDNGRRKAIAIDGSEFLEECDTILVAIGQDTVNDFLDLEVDLNRWGDVNISENGMTSANGLFAAGDFVSGASTVIDAIGHGREIAIKIDTWLMGHLRRKKFVRSEHVEGGPLRERAFDFISKQHMPTEALENRFDDMDTEVETGMDRALGFEESKRCYLCNLKYEIDIDRCIYCRACIEVAPRNCIKLVESVDIKEDGSYGELNEAAKWNKAGAIWIDNNQCIRCGACYMVCPTECISITRNELVTKDI